MNCLECGGPTKVVDTYVIGSNTRRVRVCQKKHRYHTLEVILGPEVAERIGWRTDTRNGHSRKSIKKSNYLLGVRNSQADMQKAVVDVLKDHRHRVVPYAELAQQAWLDANTPRTNIKAIISNIRKSLGKDVILTVQNVGYKWNLAE